MRCLRRLAVSALTFCVLLIPIRASEELNRNLARIFDSKELTAKRFGPARWRENGNSYTIVEPSSKVKGADDIVLYETRTGKRRVLVDASALCPPGPPKPLSIDDYRWSNDGGRLLISTNTKKVWRDNTRGDYWVLDRAANKLTKVDEGAPGSTLMFAKFSPDGSHVAYVRENNIYAEDLKGGTIRPLTRDGSVTTINGTSDWVYEEELSLRDCFRWSPDSKEIAYWQFDSSGVQQFTLLNNTDAIYPKATFIRYPKVGTTNSAVRIGVVSASGGKTRWMNVPGDPREHYLFRMDWTGGGNELAIGELNRLQNHLVVYLADARSGKTRQLFQDDDAAWVDVPKFGGTRDDQFEWLDNGEQLVWMSERDGWRHAYAAPKSGGSPRLITTAKADVIRVERVDVAGKQMYYLASPENATQAYLYRTSLDSPSEGTRVTPADEPGSHSYDISPDSHWAFHTYSRSGHVPVVDLISLPDGKQVRMLEDNAALQTAAAPLLTPPVEFFQVRLDDGTVLDGSLITPRDFDPTRKYPVIVHVYGEPASAIVTDRNNRTDYFHHALANDGYRVASFDNRGTPAPKGRAWRKVIYGSVGVLSSKEQAEALRKLIAERPYLDGTRVGVWGWSGGGTNTLNLMFRSPDLYKVGVAVAPVPDQQLYDTIYQERYMGLPSGNPDGYRSGSAINFAAGLQGKLLVIHGTGDDNVHYQGTERLINKFVELDKPFDFMEYPNRTHATAEAKGTSLHIYSLVARYFEDHLPRVRQGSKGKRDGSNL
ncbi:MAG: S9 family peptidase [Bryobacteraceae bacterium]